MDGFRVDPPVLTSFATTSEGRADAFTELRGTMADIRVSEDGFGHIPFLGSEIYDAYDEHVTACEEAVTAAAGAMSAVAAGIRACVIEYLEGERATGDDLAAVEQALDGTPLLEGS